MKAIAIRYRPSIIVSFSMDEVEMAIICSQNHYDAVCQEASMEGGFLCGIRNTIITMGTDKHGFNMSSRDIDTLAKILEVGMPTIRATYFSNRKRFDPKLLSELQGQITRAMQAINDAFMEDEPINHE